MEIKLIYYQVKESIEQISREASDYQPSLMYGRGLFGHKSTAFSKPTKLEKRFANPTILWHSSTPLAK